MQLATFRQWLLAQGLIATTVNNYVSAVQRALSAMGAVADAPNLSQRLLDAPALDDYQEQLGATQRNVLRVAWRQFHTWTRAVEISVAALRPTARQRAGGRGRPPTARELTLTPPALALIRALHVLGLTPQQISTLTWEYVTPGAALPGEYGGSVPSYQINIPPRVAGYVRCDIVDAARVLCVAVAPNLPVIQRAADCADPLTASEIAALTRRA